MSAPGFAGVSNSQKDNHYLGKIGIQRSVTVVTLR